MLRTENSIHIMTTKPSLPISFFGTSIASRNMTHTITEKTRYPRLVEFPHLKWTNDLYIPKSIAPHTIDATAIIISVLSLGFSVFMGLKSNKRTDAKDIEDRVKENTRINMKLDTILDTINDMKDERSEMTKKLSEHDSRISKIESSVSSAHHRLDGIEERLNGKE